MFVLFLSQGLCIKEAENTVVFLCEATTQIHTQLYFCYVIYGAISHDFMLMLKQHAHYTYTHTQTHHAHTHTTHQTHKHTTYYINHMHTHSHTHTNTCKTKFQHSIYTRFCEEGKALKMKRDRSGKKSWRVTQHKLPVTTWRSASELSAMKCSGSFS